MRKIAKIGRNGAKKGQNLMFSLQKSTPAWKKYTTAGLGGRDKYELVASLKSVPFPHSAMLRASLTTQLFPTLIHLGQNILYCAYYTVLHFASLKGFAKKKWLDVKDNGQ